MSVNSTMVMPTAYKGSKPYIFMSYAHKNAEEVMKIISVIQRKGYRIWYDGGIDPGVEWDQNIASHIEACAYFIAFVSDDYIASSNCKDELNYARDKEKPRLLIYLSRTDLPSGMNMRMNRLQAIHKYTYPNEGMFYEKVFDADGMSICLEESAGESVTAESSNDHEPKSAQSYAASAPIQQVPPVSNKKTPQSIAAMLTSQTSKPKGWLFIILGVVVVFFIIALIIIFYIGSANSSKDTSKKSDKTEVVTDATTDEDSANTETVGTDININGLNIDWGMTIDDVISKNSNKKFAKKVDSTGDSYLVCGEDFQFEWGDFTAYKMLLFFDPDTKGLYDYAYIFKGFCKENIIEELPNQFKKTVIDKEETGLGEIILDMQGRYTMILSDKLYDLSDATQCDIRLVEELPYAGDDKITMDVNLGMTKDEFFDKYGDCDYEAPGDFQNNITYYYYRNIKIGRWLAHEANFTFSEAGELVGYGYSIKGNHYDDVFNEYKLTYGNPDYKINNCLAQWNKDPVTNISLGLSGKYNGISTVLSFNKNLSYYK